MPVYVDAAIHRWRDKLWCHLIADDEAELHEFAQRLGLKREWYQTQSILCHYDIPEHTRTIAVELGAIQLTRKQMVIRIRAAREASPPDATTAAPPITEPSSGKEIGIT